MTDGSSTDQYVLVRPALASSRYCGTASTTGGTSTPASRMLNSADLPRNRYLASAYPVSADTATDASAPPPAYSAVLPIQCQNTPPAYDDSERTFDHSDPSGANVNVLNSWLWFLVAATSTHATGNRQYTAPRSRIAVGSAAGRSRRFRFGSFRTARGSTPVSALVTSAMPSPSPEHAPAAQPEQAVGQHEHAGRDRDRGRGGGIDVVVGECLVVDLHQRHPDRGNRVGERGERVRLVEDLERGDDREDAGQH